jgi:hypothetical protein
VNPIGDRLTALITVCSIASYMLVSIVVVGRILGTITEDYKWQWLTWVKRKYSTWATRWYAGMCVLVFVLLSLQFWGFFRLRSYQKDITTAAGGDFPDEQWTFGQIVAVIVYMPVLVEVAFTWKKQSLFRE